MSVSLGPRCFKSPESIREISKFKSCQTVMILSNYVLFFGQSKCIVTQYKINEELDRYSERQTK